MEHRIEINLLPGPKKKKRGGGPKFELPDFKELAQKVNDPLLIGAVAAWVVVLAVVGSLYWLDSRKLAELEPQVEQLQRDSLRFGRAMTLQRVSGRLLDSLQAELNAIREIDADRYTWSHLMDEITRALPDFTWLTDVDYLQQDPGAFADPGATGDELADVPQYPPPTVNIIGLTSDISAYTTFVQRLAESPWLSNVQMGPNQRILENGRAVNSFSVTVSFTQPDSAFIRMVPVISTAQ